MMMKLNLVTLCVNLFNLSIVLGKTYYVTKTEIVSVWGQLSVSGTIYSSKGSTDVASLATSSYSYEASSSVLSDIASAATATEEDTASPTYTSTRSASSNNSPFNKNAVESATSTIVSINTPTSSSSSETSNEATSTTKAASTTEGTTTSSTSSIYDDINNYSGSSDLDKTFAKSILDFHNTKRSLHSSTPDLSWSSDLFEYAAVYASKYDCSGSLVHSHGPYGENLAVGYDAFNGDAVNAWYSEGSNYDYFGNSNVLDHFTQVIWKSTTKLGCAYKSCSGIVGDYVICSYGPAGNVIGEILENVLPLDN